MSTSERYGIATNAKNMRVEADRFSQADVLIAAGWSQSRTGAALIRLYSEWDASERPQEADFGLKFSKLKSLPLVRAALRNYVLRWKPAIEAPDDLIAEVIAWWLDGVCSVCNGAQPKPVASGRLVCPSCKGSGKRRIPKGDAGRKLANFIDDALSRAGANINRRL